MQGTERGIGSSVQCIGKKCSEQENDGKSAFIEEKVKGSGNSELRLGRYDE
jgi:hypothetical protein